MGIRNWFRPRPPPALLAGMMAAIHTPVVQTAKQEFKDAMEAMESERESGILGLLLMQVALASALHTIDTKKPARFAKSLYIRFESCALKTFEGGDESKRFSAFQWLKKELSDTLGSDSVELIDKSAITLLSAACPHQAEFTRNQVASTALAATKVWEESKKFAEIAIATCEIWEPETAFDLFLKTSSTAIVHAYRQIGEKLGIASTDNLSDYEILETYAAVCTAFREVSDKRDERITAEQLNKITLKFLIMRGEAESLYIPHLEYEVRLYESSGLRQDYLEGFKLF